MNQEDNRLPSAAALVPPPPPPAPPPALAVGDLLCRLVLGGVMPTVDSDSSGIALS